MKRTKNFFLFASLTFGGKKKDKPRNIPPVVAFKSDLAVKSTKACRCAEYSNLKPPTGQSPLRSFALMGFWSCVLTTLCCQNPTKSDPKKASPGARETPSGPSGFYLLFCALAKKIISPLAVDLYSLDCEGSSGLGNEGRYFIESQGFHMGLRRSPDLIFDFAFGDAVVGFFS